MRQLRSRKQPDATIVLEEIVPEPHFPESTENAQTKQPVEGSDEQIGDTNRRKSTSQKRRNRKKKKQANLKKIVESEDGGLEMSDSPYANNNPIEVSYLAANSALSQISLNQIMDPKGLSISKKIMQNSKMNASEDEQVSDCNKDAVNDGINGGLDPEKIPGPGGPGETESKTNPVVWSNPAFCSDALSEQTSCNTGSTCSPGLADSVSYCSNLNTSEVRRIASDVRLEKSSRKNSFEQKIEVKSHKFGASNDGSPALSSNGDATQTYEVETSKLKGEDEEEECYNEQTIIQKSLFRVSEIKPTTDDRVSVSSFLKAKFENGKVESESPFTLYGNQTRIGLRSIEARPQTMHSEDTEIIFSQTQAENEQQDMSVETVQFSKDLEDLSSQRRVEKHPILRKIKADREDELDRGLEQEIEKEIAILTKRLADIHTRREARKASQDTDATSCPGTPVLAEKSLPETDTAGVNEQNTNARDKSRICKGRVVSAKFLECHSKHELRKTPTSIDRRFNLRESLMPVSSKAKPQRRGASLGGFGAVSKAEYVDNNPVHLSCDSSKEIQVERMNSTKKESQGAIGHVQAKTPKKESDITGITTKRLTGSSLTYDETGLTGNIFPKKTDFAKVRSEVATVLTPIGQERVADNILSSKKPTPEVRRSKIFPKSMAKMMHFKSDNVNGSENPAAEFEPQLFATLRESRAFRRSPITKTQLQNNELKEAATEFPEAQLLATLRENRAVRKSPVTGKVKCVPSRYGEFPRQSTPPLRSKVPHEAEKHSLSSGKKRSYPNKRLSLIKGSDEYPAISISPSNKSRAPNARSYVSPFRPKSMSFKAVGKGTQNAQSSLNCWKISSVERRHICKQDKNAELSSGATPSLANQINLTANLNGAAPMAKQDFA